MFGIVSLLPDPGAICSVRFRCESHHAEEGPTLPLPPQIGHRMYDHLIQTCLDFPYVGEWSRAPVMAYPWHLVHSLVTDEEDSDDDQVSVHCSAPVSHWLTSLLGLRFTPSRMGKCCGSVVSPQRGTESERQLQGPF